MPEIRFENVEKRFREPGRRRFGVAAPRKTEAGAVALRRFSLVIGHHEFFTFVGPSGSGKSTALNIIAGLEREFEGELFFDGRPVKMLSPRERDAAMVFQSYALYPHLTVFENIAFPLRLRKMKASELRTAVREAAVVLGLGELLQRLPRQLSGGQRQRVALARAIVRRPQVFLMDEPLSNLDAGLRLQMRAEIRRIHRTFGVTTVYVTHDQEEAMVLSDRIAVIARGELQQVAAPEQIYHRPANRFVGEFMGSPPMNVVPGDEFIRAFGAAEGALPRPAEQVLVGARPADLSTAPAERGGRGLVLRGRLLFREATGSESWAVVRSKGLELRSRVAVDSTLREGDAVAVAIDPADLHCFDRQRGTRVEGGVRGERAGGG